MARRGDKKSVETMTEDEVTRLVVDFVRRLRRVALHPLALDESAGNEQAMPGDLLRKLMNVHLTVTMVNDEPETLTTLLPDEVPFESIATRLRAFTLERDRLYWPDALAALDRLIESDDATLKATSRDLRREWEEATGRSKRVRAYFMVTDDGQRHTDVDLAYAWLYQDLAHADEVSTGRLGVQQRFEAAVGVFSHIAVVAIETLHYINALAEAGLILLPVGTFSDRVVAYTGGGIMKVTSVSEVDLDANLDEVFNMDGPMPKTERPISEVVRELREQGYWHDAQATKDGRAS